MAMSKRSNPDQIPNQMARRLQAPPPARLLEQSKVRHQDQDLKLKREQMARRLQILRDPLALPAHLAVLLALHLPDPSSNLNPTKNISM